MAWHHELAARGPLDHVGLLDATWQGEPEWDDDPWVAMDASDPVYEGPPFPGLLVRVGVRDDATLRVAVGGGALDWAPAWVATSELIVGDHGLHLSIGDATRDVTVESGNYSIDVWVDPIAPGRARAVALVLGPRQPRRLPDRLR
jgi:hypothetical protein